MKCPRCQEETLTHSFWVPSGDGAYRMFECGTCGTLCRGGGTSRSGEFAIVTALVDGRHRAGDLAEQGV